MKRLKKIRQFSSKTVESYSSCYINLCGCTMACDSTGSSYARVSLMTNERIPLMNAARSIYQQW